MTGQQWVRSSLRSLCDRLEAVGHPVSPPTVARLLKGLGYSLRVNSKKIEASSNHPDRNQQFDYIAVQRAAFTAAGLPIISTDTKKKELVGDFKNPGRAWVLEPSAVNVHDFPGDALGRAVPYGVYDLTNNRGIRLSRHLGRHASVRRGCDRRVVASRRASHLAQPRARAGAGRCWRQQQLPLARMERTRAGADLRSLRFDGDGVPLSNWMLEMEPDRAPII